jgi:mannose-6-phosphate isomerase
LNEPLHFEPHLKSMVWGGRQLEAVLGKRLPTAAAYGESWEISDHPSHASVIAKGPLRGQTLRQVMSEHPKGLLGAAARSHTTFPWLVKLLDAWDWLSVQVHPPEHLVSRLWAGENSKTEAWFVLAASPTSRVYAGLLPGVDEAQLRAALSAGTVADCLHHFQPRPGDCVFLQAGTVHAVGGGVLMAEVQQTSDATFRLFDWNRVDANGNARKLHLEEAIDCVDWRAGPVHPVRAEGYPVPGSAPVAGASRQELVRCKYFDLDYICDTRPFALGGRGCMQVLVALHGKGSLHGSAFTADLAPGDSLVLPAQMQEIECRPAGPMGILLSTLPDRAALET